MEAKKQTIKQSNENGLDFGTGINGDINLNKLFFNWSKSTAASSCQMEPAGRCGH